MIDHLRERGLGVDPVCQVLDLSPSTYFARKKRPKSACRLRDEQLMPLIEEIHAESSGTYGARRITRALRRKGIHVARCTVERLMYNEERLHSVLGMLSPVEYELRTPPVA